jgi:hypothetical protein
LSIQRRCAGCLHTAVFFVPYVINLPVMNLPSVIIIAVALLLDGCQATVPAVDAAATVPAAATAVAGIPFTGSADHVLADDFDGDGRPDLAFTSHAASYTQVFYQRARRRFEPGPRVDAVGFHPDGLLRLPGQNRSLYLMNAEGINQLLVMAPAPSGGLAVVSSRPAAQPKSTTPFRWPGWGLSLAVAPFSNSAVTLLKDFDPLTGRAEAMVIPLSHTYVQVGEIAAADLDGDGVDELVFATDLTNDVWVIRCPKTGEPPRIELLWHFDHGGLARYVVPVDINRDGYVDLLLPNQTGPDAGKPTVINVLLNDKSGHFRLASELPFPVRTVSWGVRGIDIANDKDGALYLFGAGAESFTLYRFPVGWAGEKPDMRTLDLQNTESPDKALLRDLDGDGWLDAVVARGIEQDSGLILYGPLWDNFARLAGQGVKVR